jgi:predicted ribosome quality control (RQC) complex YloA/Tae2 family protein
MLMAEKKGLEKNISSLKTHIASLGQSRNYRHQADLLMANMHVIPLGADKVTVQDFETGKDIILKLKKELTPQAWAEKLYHKSRGQQKEKEITEAQLKQAEEKLAGVESLLENQAAGESISIKSPEKAGRKPEEKESPFRSVNFQGYAIYIGKSASNNDDLTFRFAHKEDTWLHARGVSGSHVIIRHKAKGKDIPKPVLEAAASLAAFNSKAKHSSLVPVAYTLRKFVRKPKGAAPGAVVIEKEKVILVEPDGQVGIKN